MRSLQRIGGLAALLAAAAFVVGFALYATFVSPEGYDVSDVDDPGKSVEFLADNQAVMYVWNFVIYVLFGLVLVVVALALHERIKVGSPALARTATVFGLIWAGLVIAAGMVANIGLGAVVDLHDQDPDQAESVWLALASVENGLGGGYEIVGGVWVLLASWAALRGEALPRALGYLGLVIGVAGLLTVVPPLEVLGAVFGLGLVVWFVWLGILLLSDKPGTDLQTGGSADPSLLPHEEQVS